MFGWKPRKVDAVGIWTEGGKVTKETDIKKCCHCGKNWNIVPGSGIQRSFCRRCMDDCCSPQCGAKCIPHEKWLEKESKLLNLYNKLVNGY